MWLSDRPNPTRNPYVRPLLLAVISLFLGMGACKTSWGETTLLESSRTGPLFKDQSIFKIDLPGFRYLKAHPTPAGTPPEYLLKISYGFLCFVAGVAVAVWQAERIRRIVIKRRALPGTCESCGYDLRASRDRCPECGRRITAARRSAELPDSGIG